MDIRPTLYGSYISPQLRASMSNTKKKEKEMKKKRGQQKPSEKI